jgi:hypothetical protein
VFLVVVIVALGVALRVPWWLLVLDPQWATPVGVIGTVVFGAGVLAFPFLMYLGHSSRGRDWAARIADTTLGVVWVMFAWSILGAVPRIVLAIAGVDDPRRSRIVAGLVVATTVVLVAWGVREAMRTPRIRETDVTMPRLGAGLDGTKVVVLADTHYGPINRARWSARMGRRGQRARTRRRLPRRGHRRRHGRQAPRAGGAAEDHPRRAGACLRDRQP